MGAAEVADGQESGHGDEALAIAIKYADTVEKQQACLAALAESADVLNFHYDVKTVSLIIRAARSFAMLNPITRQTEPSARD